MKEENRKIQNALDYLLLLFFPPRKIGGKKTVKKLKKTKNTTPSVTLRRVRTRRRCGADWNTAHFLAGLTRAKAEPSRHQKSKSSLSVFSLSLCGCAVCSADLHYASNCYSSLSARAPSLILLCISISCIRSRSLSFFLSFPLDFLLFCWGSKFFFHPI